MSHSSSQIDGHDIRLSFAMVDTVAGRERFTWNISIFSANWVVSRVTQESDSMGVAFTPPPQKKKKILHGPYFSCFRIHLIGHSIDNPDIAPHLFWFFRYLWQWLPTPRSLSLSLHAPKFPYFLLVKATGTLMLCASFHEQFLMISTVINQY